MTELWGSFLFVSDLLIGHEPGLVTSSPTMRKFDKVEGRLMESFVSLRRVHWVGEPQQIEDEHENEDEDEMKEEEE